MMHTTQLRAFAQEVEKLAIDVRRVAVPGLGNVHGMYVQPHLVASSPQAQALAAGKPKLLVERPLGEYRQMVASTRDYMGASPESIDRAAGALRDSIRRHELTHYLRDKAGKLPPTGPQHAGLRNVLRLAREEGIAHLEGVTPLAKVSPRLGTQAAAGVVPGVVASVRHAYGPIRRAMLSGTLKPMLPLAEKLKLVR